MSRRCHALAHGCWHLQVSQLFQSGLGLPLGKPLHLLIRDKPAAQMSQPSTPENPVGHVPPLSTVGTTPCVRAPAGEPRRAPGRFGHMRAQLGRSCHPAAKSRHQWPMHWLKPHRALNLSRKGLIH
eukprot:1622780-Amphidinium_carterae.1